MKSTTKPIHMSPIGEILDKQAKPAQVIRLKPELWEAIDNQAEKEERSRNKMIELLIRRGMGQIEAHVNGKDLMRVGPVGFDINKVKL